MSPENANPRAELEARLRFETLLAELSSKFVNLPAGDVDREILDALRRVCALLDLDLLVFWQPSDEAPDSFCVTHFYYAPQDPASPEHFKEENYPWFKQELLAGRIASFASLEQLPAEAARDRESFRQAGTKSNLSLPLLVGGGSLIGAFCLNALRTERDWPNALVKRLQLVAQIFANALARKRADQERRESEERMALAAEAAEFGVWGWNIAQNQVWGTERWLRLFGFVSGEDISFEKVIQRIHPDNRAQVEREVRHASVNARNYAGEFRVVLPDGTQRWIAFRGRGYQDASGKPVRMLGAATDITERKESEAELQRLRLNLWHTDRVVQTGAITASLAHELNQPLTAILSNAQAGLRFMDGGKLDLEEMRAILTDIVHDDKRAGAVISGLRNMLRRKETQRERIDLADAVEEVFVLVHSELVEQQVELRQRLAPATLVMADKGQLQQVILNLVMNAMQAMQNQPADQRRLELMLTQTETGEARLAVCDSGPGIPEEQQGKLFEPFWTTKNQGLGIGLHISRSIIESHGGRLSFANRPDRGATFSITLPLAKKNR